MLKKNIIDGSNEKYKLLAENSPDILLQTTKTGKIIFMSRNVESEYGYKLDEVIGRHFRNFVPTSEIPRYLLKMKEMILGKTVTGFRTYAKHKDGHLIPIELSGKFITYKKKSYFNAIMRNISRRIETEEALRESELQRKFILETIPDLLFIINKQGIFVSYHGNPNTLYQPPEFFLNKKVVNVLPEPLGRITIDFVKKALKTKKIQIFEYNLEIKNKVNWFEARMLAISKYNVMIIVRDITSLKEQQDQLIKNKEYLQSLINGATEIIFTIDINKKIIIWNNTAKKLSGYNRKEIINNSININKLINNLVEFESYLSEIIEKRKIKSFKIIINTKYKTKRLWAASPSIIYNKSNEISEILFICKDVTYEKDISSKIIFGRSYIFFDKTSENAFNIFCNILNNKHNSLIITRGETEEINQISKKRNIELIQLSSQKKRINAINDPVSLFNLIETKISKNSIIYLDRLDYFFNLYSYGEITSNLYKINDIIQNRGALLIIRLNPYSLSDKQIAALKEEFFEYTSEKIGEITIDKDLYEILEFIDSRNKNNIIVTYKEIGIKFLISKNTVSKKIDKLTDLNLMRSFKSGRTKILELTKEGQNIIKNKKE